MTLTRHNAFSAVDARASQPDCWLIKAAGAGVWLTTEGAEQAHLVFAANPDQKGKEVPDLQEVFNEADSEGGA